MENSKNYILDTSSLISLESINLLDQILNLFTIITTNSVIKELENFAKYDGRYGRIAKSILKFKKRLRIETCEIIETINYIEQTDNELYNLSLKMKLPLITDETKFVHHAREKIDIYFTPIFLAILIESKYLTKNDALNKLERLRDIRNWRSNIIYLTSKKELDKL